MTEVFVLADPDTGRIRWKYDPPMTPYVLLDTFLITAKWPKKHDTLKNGFVVDLEGTKRIQTDAERELNDPWDLSELCRNGLRPASPFNGQYNDLVLFKDTSDPKLACGYLIRTDSEVEVKALGKAGIEHRVLVSPNGNGNGQAH